jgi:hypothetical protein
MMAVRAALLFVLAVIGVVCAVSDGARVQQVAIGPHVRVIVKDEKGWPIAGARVQTFDGSGFTNVYGVILVPTQGPVHLVISKQGYIGYQGYFGIGDADVTLYTAYRVNE